MKIEHKATWDSQPNPQNKVEIIEEDGENLLSIDIGYSIKLESLEIEIEDMDK